MDEPRRYDSIKRVVAVCGFILDVLILIVLLFSGFSLHIREWLETLSGSEWTRIGIYTVIITAIFSIPNVYLGALGS